MPYCPGENLAVMSQTFVLNNTIAELPALAESIEDLGERADLSPKMVYALNLVLDEWLTNLISYAYPADSSREIHVLIEIDGEQVTLEIRDDGTAFNPLTQAPPAPTIGSLDERPIGGLGLYLLKTLMDHIEYDSAAGWNRLRLTRTRR